MEDILEVKHTDLGARLGILHTNHGNIEIPAFVPVIHPVKQELSIDVIKEMGFDLVITNAYIAMKRYGKDYNKSIHQTINFDKSIMTDSGGYQVLEYGELDVSYEEVARFEERIRSDIAVPLDKPTSFKLDKSDAVKYVRDTLKAAKATIDMVDDDIIWVGPIQGGRYLDLIRYSAKELDELGYKMFALGSPTEVMEAYEFKVLAEMIVTARNNIPSNKPLHLFGAGMPLTIPLAVALGCDTFDSASYMLYAKDDRYMLTNGTANLRDLAYLPCNCPVCSRYKASELSALDKDERVIEIAKHNLYTIKREVDAVKQAIIDGRLWEYIIQKSYSHPKLYDANEILLKTDFKATPLYKEHAVFFFNSIDQYRPEAVRFREMLKNVRYKGLLILIPEQDRHPLYTTSIYAKIKSMVNATIAYYSPFLSIVPEELSDVFPAAHHLSSSNHKPDDYPTFKEAFLNFLKNNEFDDVIIVADEFMNTVIKELQIDCKLVRSYDELFDILIRKNY